MTITSQITDAGRAAASAAKANSLLIEVAEFAIGTGKYTPLASRTSLEAEVARFAISESSDLGGGLISVSSILQDPVDTAIVFSSDTVTLASNAEVRGVVLKSADRNTTYTVNSDYTVDEATGAVTRLGAGAIAAGATALATFRYYFDVGEIGVYLADGTLFAAASSPTDLIAIKSGVIPGIPIEVQLNLVGLPAENITVTTSGEALNLFNAEKELSNLTLHLTHAANHVRLSTALAARGIYA